MTKDMVCVICPKSCPLSITKNNENIQVKNNSCPKGKDFAVRELTDPERILTSTIKVRNGNAPLVSVRSETPVKKAELRDLVKQLDGLTLSAPIVIGQVLLSSIGKNKVTIIATRTVTATV